MPERRPRNPNTESVDNYLKAILALSGPEELRVTSKALADHLGIAPASATNMLQKLARAASPLVEYELHRGVRLSPAGRTRALEILRHHRLLETFLFEILDYPIEEVHDEAERLEHFISERFEERIAAKLGQPRFDPHGHGIPARDGRLPPPRSTALSDAASDEPLVVDSVSDQNVSALRQLGASGIAPGTGIRVRRREQDGGFAVTLDDSSHLVSLSAEAVAAIQVRPGDDAPPRSASPAAVASSRRI